MISYAQHSAGKKVKGMASEIEVQAEGITGYWTSDRCSVCFHPLRVLRLAFGYDVIRLCEACGTAMRELLIDALEEGE